jgi:hypothetical protein
LDRKTRLPRFCRRLYDFRPARHAVWLDG